MFPFFILGMVEGVRIECKMKREIMNLKIGLVGAIRSLGKFF